MPELPEVETIKLCSTEKNCSLVSTSGVEMDPLNFRLLLGVLIFHKSIK